MFNKCILTPCNYFWVFPLGPPEMAQHDAPGGVLVERSKEMLGSIAVMFNHEDTADVSIVVGPHRFYLHKLLLLRSGVFKVMLGNKNWQDSSKPELELNEEEICIPHMEEFFRYFYTGKIYLNEKNLIPLLVLANKYDLSDLEQACEEFGSAMVYEGLDVAQVLEWCFMAERTNLKYLWEKCRTYLLLNMGKVFKSPLFLDLTLDQLVGFIREPEMVVNAEVGLFLKVWKWLEHNFSSDKEKMEENLLELLPHIKLCMMNHEHLIAVEKRLRKHWQQDRFNALFSAQLLSAYKFHAVPFRKRPKVNIGHLDMPRLYTDATSQNSCLCMLLPLSEDLIGETFSGKIPVSLSSTDQNNVKMWGGQVAQTDSGVELEMWLMGEKISIACVVDITVLIHKQVLGDRIMQLLLHHRQFVEKRVTRHMANPSHGGGTPVKFSVQLETKMLEESSPYMIPYQRKKCCILNIFVRHLQPVTSSGNIPDAESSSEEEEGAGLTTEGLEIKQSR